MSAPVDVLAVLDRAHRVADPQRFHAREDLAEARAAVAELIEADREFDSVNASDHLYAAQSDEEALLSLARCRLARERRAAALARCTGGQ